MVKQENPNFIASKYAPNPKEVSYWIDLATDSTGNVIKSYSPDLKKWIPLNRDANVDQRTHIKEIVQSVGLNYDKDSGIISLPDNSSNNYFKGSSIVDAINKGDAAVKAQVDRLDTKIDDVNEDLQDFKALKGQPNGLAELDGNGKVPASQLPSNEDITELRTTLLKVNDKVGLTEANEMPDLSSTNYLANSPSAISAAVTLDEEIGKLSRNENELWYGVKFDLANSSSPDGVRTGNMEMHRTLPIQSKMRGCTINNDDNTKRYLKADDWNKWEDGVTITDDSKGMAPEIMVEIPEHYRLLIATPDNTVEIRMSEYNLPGYTKVEKKYIGAYEGSVNLDSSSHNNLLRTQVRNTAPIISKTRTEFQTMARNNNRTNNWNIYTYDAHRDLTWLFVVEYATLNSQKAFNANLTAEGYHQGGLGDGVTSGTVTVNGATTYSFVPCGTTNSLGNGTGIIEYTHTNTNAEGTSTGTKVVNVPRYRGIENPFGHVCKNVIDVVVAGTDNSVYICKDYTKFGTFEGGTNPTAEQLIAAGYELQDFKESTITGQYVKKLVNNNQADLFPTVVVNGASTTIYYCDYHWTGATAAPRTLLIGGRSGVGSVAGLFYLLSRYELGYSNTYIGTRITFYGEPALPAAPATLELNDEDYEQLDSIESEENWF